MPIFPVIKALKSASVSLCLVASLAQPAFSQSIKLDKQSSITADEVLTSMVSNADPVQLKAFHLVDEGKRKEAALFLKSSLSSASSPESKIGILYLLTLLSRVEDKPNEAVGYLNKIDELLKAGNQSYLEPQMKLHKRLADAYFEQRKVKDSISHYKSALICSDYLDDKSDLTLEILESLSGSLIYEKHYCEAIEYLQKLKELLSAKLSSNSLFYKSLYFWNLLQLADASNKAGNMEINKSVADELGNLLDTVIDMRAELKSENKLSTYREHTLLEYLNRNAPDSISECLFLAYDARQKIKSLPLIAWKNETETCKGAIICIHGMGLQNSSFESFGIDMAKQGYSVYALDVRGFGSWLATTGREEIMFSETIDDIQFVIDLVRNKEPGVPVFVLGESMGGAIALRAAAELGDVVNGVIASVPSATRFKEGKMALDVAMHFLRSPSKPYQVIDKIAAQATSRPELIASWVDDPKTKSKASPNELINFDLFMRQTEHACKKIKDTPVFIVQGLKDALVKPQGTFKMFENISNQDKSILVIGQAEHLIIETDKQNDLFFGALLHWLEEHRQNNVSGSESKN